MIDGFVQSNGLLEEKSDIKDLLDFTDICNKFSKKLDSIKESSVIALVGPFGSGKSTMLNQLSLTRLDREKWFEFDAWKYPDRQNLWEGFVLDTLASIDEKELEKAKKEITGTQNADKTTLVTTLSKIPGFAALEGLNHFLATTPARRVCDIQEIFNKHLQKNNRDLVIIVEDIDRSGDSGIFFLETLKQFLRTHKFKKKILIIVPMANDNYEKNIDSYLKSVDYFEFFEVPDIKLENFVNEVFDPSLFDGHQTENNKKTQIIDFLEGLFKEMPNMNMRLLKLILRKANVSYKNETGDGLEPDFRLTICFEASKYFEMNENVTYYKEFKKEKFISSNSIFFSFLLTILINDDKIYERSYSNNKEILKLRTSSLSFKIFDRLKNDIKGYPSVPYEYGTFERGYGIVSFYLNY